MDFMKYQKDGKSGWAVIEGDEAYAIAGEPARGVAKGAALGKVSGLKVLSPVDFGRKVVALLGNWGKKNDRSGPGFFIKPASCLVNPGENVVSPKMVKRLYLEPEIGVVIGTRAKRVSVADAKKHILGYTVSNDLTAFETEKQNVNFGVLYGKSFDTFAVLGPRIVTGIDPTNATLRASLNGEEFLKINTSLMLWNVYEIVAWISEVMTLDAGDIISMGAPPGFDAKNLKPGDRMAVSIDGIGTIENPIVQGD